MKLLHFIVISAMTLLFSGCPITEKQSPAPCTEHAECLPGFECRVARCVACDQVCLERPGEGVGPRGASVCGADNVCLHFPPDTLLTPQSVAIQRLPEGASLPNASSLSPIYSILPSDLMLEMEVTIEIPITSSTSPDQVAVYQSDTIDGPWTKLTGTSTTNTAIGVTDRLTLFTAGRTDN